MPISNKVTIVLTLKGRTPFTYRWLRYMNEMYCPYKILIADGGEDHAIEQYLGAHENYPHLDYEYIRYPYDRTIDDYYRKFENVISRVESDYLLLADNDDFYLLERIPDILTFLDTHQDYVGARGRLVDLALFDRAGLSNGLTVGVRYAAVENDALSIESTSLFERIEALCKDMRTYDYYANWYCVFRSSSFKKVWKSLITLSIKEVIVTEVLTHVLMLTIGKIKIMPFPFYIRQSNTSMFGDTLVVGNEFLERCIVNNALSEFGVAVDQFVTVQTREERERILRAIAAWLEVFVANIYWGRVRVKTSVILCLRERIRCVPLLDSWVTQMYYRLTHPFSPLPMRARKHIRLKSIEPYILAQSKNH
jgi:glycosyltransferase domain-containing protein